MKAVLISIHPEWCDLIATGKKTVEVRKTKPKLETPFKAYIYCTKGDSQFSEGDRFCLYTPPHDTPVNANQKVIGEFVCDKIFDICIEMSDPDALPGCPFPATGLTDKEILQYLGNGKTGHGWHIFQLKIYDKPVPVTAFRKLCVNELYCESCGMHCENTGACGNAALQLTRPPQSWCYVEELKDAVT